MQPENAFFLDREKDGFPQRFLGIRVRVGKAVFWIVDNGSSHAGKASIARMGEAWPTATLVHLPVHASWLNQIEIVFSVIQRKVVKPAEFDDLEALAQRLIEFEPRYNATAGPFDWRFTRADLNDLVRRIEMHRSGASEQPAA